jgi:peptidoglycan/LPS O-acetylase OafA/YrhL
MIGRESATSSPPSASKERPLLQGSPSVHLDALRGFAAFSVLLNHWRDAFFLDYRDIAGHNPLVAGFYLIAGLGHQWVIVFFVMSGYLVGGSVVRSVSSGRWSWRGYLLTRLTRLYIVLLPALMLGGALDWTGIHEAGTESVYSGHSGMHALEYDVQTHLHAPTFLGNSLFVQTIALPGMGGDRVLTFGSNGPLWSLSNEFWYYLAFPLLVLLLMQAGPWWERAAYGFVLLLWGWFVGSSIALLGIPWLMGVLIVYLPAFPARRPWTRSLAIVAALALLGGGLTLVRIWQSRVSENSMGSQIGDVLLGLVVTLLIWVTLHCATAPLPSFYVRLAQRAARSSYTLYLVHLPLVVFLKASLNLPRMAPSWHAGLVSVGILLVVVVYAQLVFEIFEKNTAEVRNWMKPYVMGGKAA